MIPKICLFAIISVLLSVLLGSLGFKSKGLFITLVALIMLGVLGDGLSNVFGEILSFSEMAGITDAAKSALRVIGLGYVFSFTSEICLSLGEPLIASVVTAAGRVQLLVVVYPYIEDVVKLGSELLS